MSSEKTNKSFKKRIKVTASGKLLTKKRGTNHFNAKESREKQLGKKGYSRLNIKNKSKNRFMPHDNTDNRNKVNREK